MSTEDEIEYYLRTPIGFPRYVNRDAQAAGDSVITDYGDYSRTFYCLGIRPAFYLNDDNAVILSGNGTEEEPYVITGKTENVDDEDHDTSTDETGHENPSGISVFYNGSEISFDQSPFIESDRVLVPMRAIFETLGAEVLWNEDEQSITAAAEDNTIVMQIGNEIITRNGETLESEVAPRLIGDRTFIPLRVISESFSADVDWNEDLQRVIITR